MKVEETMIFILFTALIYLKTFFSKTKMFDFSVF